KVQVERVNESHALCPHVGVDSNKCFIQKNEAWCHGVCRSIEGRCCGEVRQREGNCFLSTGAGSMCSARQPLPYAILVAFDTEPMPLAVVERFGERFLPAGAVHLGTHGLNLSLEELPQHLPFGKQPLVTRFHQTLSCRHHTRRTVFNRFPDE